MVRIPSIDDIDVAGKKVLLRVDINSPVDLKTGQLADFNRIDKSVPTIRDLADRGRAWCSSPTRGTPWTTTT